jgi:hypothetical protein
MSDLKNEIEQYFEDYNRTGKELYFQVRFAERLYKLSQQNFKSSSELDFRINEIMNEIERQFFFGKLLKKIKKKALGKLIKLSKKFIKGLPASRGIDTITQLSRGNLKGALTSIARAGLSSLVSGGPVSIPILNALNSISELPNSVQNDLKVWKNFVNIAEYAYENLIDNFKENAIIDPISASKLANKSFQNSIMRTK